MKARNSAIKKGNPDSNLWSLGASGSDKASNAAWTDTQGTTLSFFYLAFLSLATEKLTGCFFRALALVVWPQCCCHALAQAAEQRVLLSAGCGRDQLPVTAGTRCEAGLTLSMLVWLSLLFDKIKMEQEVCERGMGLGCSVNQGRLDCMAIFLSLSQKIMDLRGLYGYFPFPRPKDNGFKPQRCQLFILFPFTPSP